MRNLRWAGLVFSLSIVGVLGGLMAALPSEAGTPKVTLDVDGTKYSLTVGSSSSCSFLSGETGFSACYAITSVGPFAGGSGRSYGIRATGTGVASPRILIGDTASGDNFRLTNMEIYPTTTGWAETHNLKIYVDVTMDVASATVTCTTKTSYDTCLASSTPVYTLPQKIGGQFYAPGLTRSSNNYIRYDGYGYFTNQQGTSGGTNGLPTNIDTELASSIVTKLARPDGGLCTAAYYANNGSAYPTSSITDNDDINKCALRRNVGTVTAEPASFSGTSPGPNLEQTTPYATFKCLTAVGGALGTGSGTCKPRIIEKVTVTLNGADTFRLQTTAAACGGACDATNNAGGQLTPQGPPCFANSKKIKSLQNQCAETFAQQEAAELLYDQNTFATYPPLCTENCGCPDPDVCTGTIVIEVEENPAVAGLTFPFTGTGPGIPNPGCLVTSPTSPPYSQQVPNTFCVGDLPTNSNGVATKTFSDIKPVGFNEWTFTADLANFPPVPQSGFDGTWKIDSISCTSKLNDIVLDSTGQIDPNLSTIVSAWTTDTGNPKLKATVTQLGGGDTVKCVFHGHKNSAGK